MPVVAAEVIMYKSTFVGSDTIPSLGGAITGNQVTDGLLHDLFNPVDAAESTAGHVDYRCVFFRNTNLVDTLQSAVVYIATNTPSADTEVAIGLDPAGINNPATTIADELTAPVGVVFTAPDSGSPLVVGDLVGNAYIGLWIRRTVNAGAVAAAGDNVVIQMDGVSA